MKCLVIATALLVAVAPGAMAAAVGAGGFENQLSGAVDTNIERLGEGQFRGVIGGGVGAANSYVGGDETEVVPLPLFDVEWRGAYFLSTQRGMGLNIIRKRTLKMGPRLTVDRGRDAGDDSFLAGMTDIDPTIEGGVFLVGFGGPWRVKADLRRGFSSGGHEGIVGSLDVAYGARMDDRTNVIIGGSVHWANDAYTSRFFGVTAAEATATRPAFTGDSGIQDFGGYLNVVFNFTERIFISAQARAANLTGSAADSPLSENDLQFFTGTLLGFRF